MRTRLVAGLLAALLVSVGPLAGEAFAQLSYPVTEAGSATAANAIETQDSTASHARFTRASLPMHAARNGRIARTLRRAPSTRPLHAPVINTPTPRASHLETRQAELPTQYFLLDHVTAPRAPALS